MASKRFTAEDVRELQDAEDMVALRNYPPYLRLRAMLDAVVQESHEQMAKNRDRDKAYDMQLAWSERKVFLDFIDGYIDAISHRRRDVVRQLLSSLGLDPDKIEQHIDMSTNSIAFIQRQLGGQV